VANVSLAKGVEPPKELAELSRNKVVGLVIDPLRLSEIRRRRQDDWRMGSNSYDEFDAVRQEVAWSRRLFGKHGWHVIDVTNNAIEETAGRILDLLRLPRSTGALRPDPS
jgi:[pyruvate, water dikinase]-phosphate phosphotransferase / [pyruvate, water dikinase] kinase